MDNVRESCVPLSPGGPYLASVSWDAPAFLNDTIQPVSVPGHQRRSPRQFGGAAVDVNPERAIARAKGELQERMALRRPSHRRLRFATRAEMGEPAIDVTDVLTLESDDAHRLPKAFEAQTWVRGAALASGKPVWVSGETVWPTSTGSSTPGRSMMRPRIFT